MLDWTRRHTLKLQTRVWWCFFLSFFFFRQLNAFQVFRACWGLDGSHSDELPACIRLYRCSTSDRTALRLTAWSFTFKKKKGFYNCNSVYVCVIIIMKTGSMKLRILLSVFRQKHNQPPHLCSSVDFIMIVVTIFSICSQMLRICNGEM